MIPGGFKFVQPELSWQAPAWASFEVIVQAVIAARSAHPALVQKYNWNLDYGKVAQEVDDFNTRICQAMGYKHFISAGGGGQPSPPPFLPTSPPTNPNELAAAAAAVKAIWAGIRTLNDWIDAGGQPVPQAQAESRAAICATCPQNGAGGMESWFTKPAAEAIKRQVEKMSSRNLKTAADDKLGVCQICFCPLKLKAFAPMEFIKAHMSDEVLSKLRAAPACWIPRELDGK